MTSSQPPRMPVRTDELTRAGAIKGIAAAAAGELVMTSTATNGGNRREARGDPLFVGSGRWRLIR
jgi:hypothetical protein